MKKSKFLYLLPLFCLGLVMTSCGGDDDPTNTITITIEEPLNDSVITNCEEVHVHVEFEASVENHEVEVVLHPEGDVNDKILDIDMHEHDRTFEIEQEVNLCSYAAGTCFHLEVKACVDHDCTTSETAEAEFCLQ